MKVHENQSEINENQWNMKINEIQNKNKKTNTCKSVVKNRILWERIVALSTWTACYFIVYEDDEKIELCISEVQERVTENDDGADNKVYDMLFMNDPWADRLCS